MAILYIVATPIGNLEDLSFRALRVLRGVDFILCEDTRVTKKLLLHYNIQKSLISYHQHSRLQKIEYIADLLKQRKNLALVSDAGTPGISDPGNKLIHYIAEKLTDRETEKLNIVPVPGASAVTAIASIAGFPMDKFLFLGFPPHKKKRAQFFERIAQSDVPVILYESPYRIVRTLKDLESKIQNPKSKIVVGRELTKKFETVYRGTIEEVLAQIENEGPRGEYAVVVGRPLI